MITIVSGTNRKGSNTLKVAREYQRLLKEKDVDTQLFSLEGVNVLEKDAAFEKIENEIIIPTTTFIFIVPEYNGSFPGVLKLLIDNSRSHEIWFHKQALITGNATGRAGNLRGMDHLADILNYLKITVHPNKLPISQVNKLMDAEGYFTDPGTLKAINNQLDEFLQWSALAYLFGAAVKP
ncbi:MAG: NAD(P)H-dependent oxidoreductase [Bacteroidetes bacterium]|nr:NAD(P)H-dependent oxidoreductase [Bacteroidota bacterium]